MRVRSVQIPAHDALIGLRLLNKYHETQKYHAMRKLKLTWELVESGKHLLRSNVCFNAWCSFLKQSMQAKIQSPFSSHRVASKTGNSEKKSPSKEGKIKLVANLLKPKIEETVGRRSSGIAGNQLVSPNTPQNPNLGIGLSVSSRRRQGSYLSHSDVIRAQLALQQINLKETQDQESKKSKIEQKKAQMSEQEWKEYKKKLKAKKQQKKHLSRSEQETEDTTDQEGGKVLTSEESEEQENKRKKVEKKDKKDKKESNKKRTKEDKSKRHAPLQIKVPLLEGQAINEVAETQEETPLKVTGLPQNPFDSYYNSKDQDLQTSSSMSSEPSPVDKGHVTKANLTRQLTEIFDIYS